MLLSCTVIGRLSRPAKVRPRMKSFQMPVTWRIVATISIGVDIGSITRPEDREEAAAVDPRGIEQLARQRRVEVAEQERHDRHAEDDVDRDDPRQRVVDADRREQPDQRIEEHLVGMKAPISRITNSRSAPRTRQKHSA